MGEMMQAGASYQNGITQKDISHTSILEQQREFDAAQAIQRPWVDAGTTAINSVSSGTQPGGRFYQTPQLSNYSMADFQNSPEYQLMLTQQQNILDANRAGAAANGSFGSGNQKVALQRLAGQNAESYFQQGYNNNLTEYNANVNAFGMDYNRLAGLAGIGQTSAGQVASQGIQTGQGIANTLGNYGNQVGQNYQNIGNAMGGMQNQLMGAYGAYNQNNMYQSYLTNMSNNITGWGNASTPGDWNYDSSGNITTGGGNGN